MLANDPDEFYVQAFATREGAAGILDSPIRCLPRKGATSAAAAAVLLCGG